MKRILVFTLSLLTLFGSQASAMESQASAKEESELVSPYEASGLIGCLKAFINKEEPEFVSSDEAFALIRCIKDFINEDTDEILREIMSYNQNNFDEIDQLFKKLLRTLKNKDRGSFTKKLEKISNKEFPVGLTAVDIVECLFEGLDEEKTPSGSVVVLNEFDRFKRSLTCSHQEIKGIDEKTDLVKEVSEILPNITTEPDYALDKSQVKKFKNLFCLGKFNEQVVRGIESSIKNGDYNELRDCTSNETMEDFMKDCRNDLLSETYHQCENFVKENKDVVEKFDESVKGKGIKDLVKKAIDCDDNGDVQKSMQEGWQGKKSTLQTDVECKQKKIYKQEELKNEAEKQGNALKESGVLQENDLNFREANSENFVKAFIRYLERRFFDLKDNVNILYFPGDMSPARNRRYSKSISELKQISKTNDKIYFVINQLCVCEEGEIGYGHGNLTIVGNGISKLIDSSPSVKKRPVDMDPDNTSTLQSGYDTGNCVSIALGMIESFLRQIREIKGKDSQKVSENFMTYITGFMSKEVTHYSLTPTKEKEILLPPKCLKYLQSGSRIGNFLEMAREINEDDPNYNEVKQVAEEFTKVKEYYFRSIQSRNGVKEINVRANMKRQTEVLKIDQLVEALKKAKKDVLSDINKVRTLK
ncbi:MAG: hypothetical protein ACI4PR_05920 [Acutalibacteraceae bacterium]